MPHWSRSNSTTPASSRLCHHLFHHHHLHHLHQIILWLDCPPALLVTNMSPGDILSASGDGWIAAYFITSWEIHPFVQPLRLSLYGTDFFIRRPRCPKTHISADGPCIKNIKITPIVWSASAKGCNHGGWSMVAQLDLLVPREMHQSKVIRGKRETHEINIDLQRGFYLTRVVRHKELRMSFAPWRPLSRSKTINLNLLCYALFFPIFAERSLLSLLLLSLVCVRDPRPSVQDPLLHRRVLGHPSFSTIEPILKLLWSSSRSNLKFRGEYIL